jgi:hypothetical protein
LRNGASDERRRRRRQLDLAGLSVARRRSLSAFGLTRGAKERQNRRLASHVVIAMNTFRRHDQPHRLEQALFYRQALVVSAEKEQ